MQIVYIDPKMTSRHQWERFWPTGLVAIIGVCQFFVTNAIIGLELWSFFIDPCYSFFFIGFLAAFFYIITWISTFVVVCCNRGSQGCAIHALIEHSLSIVASCVLLYYDALFLRQPLTSLWPNNTCTASDWDNLWLSLSLYERISLKSQVIKGQIAGAAIMLALSVVFIGIYIYTSIRVHKHSSIVEPHTSIELGRTQPPPPPFWPPPPPPISDPARY